jgi:hypothetical protein
MGVNTAVDVKVEEIYVQRVYDRKLVPHFYQDRPFK